MPISSGVANGVRGFRAWRRQVREDRGYDISYERLILACVAEFFVIAASLWGNWLFAHLYGHGDPVQIQMMMLAPVGYAVIELTRVPLALSARTQTSRWLRALALIGVICAAGVTIKSMSQLGEIMFRPRLIDVVQAKEALVEARNEQATLVKRIADADTVVEQRKSELDHASERQTNTATQLATLPAPTTCLPTTSYTRRGRRVTGAKCVTDTTRPAVLAGTLKNADGALALARDAFNQARADRDKLDRQPADKRASDAEVAYRDAVLHSQLHSFTAMVFGKDPTEVSDQQIHQFLRVFVFLPAVFVAFASAMLAYTAVIRHKPRPEPLELDDRAGQYILDPFARQIVQDAVEAASRHVEESLERAKTPPVYAQPVHAPPASAPVVPLKIVSDTP